MKLKYKNCLDTLNEALGFRPTHSDISKVINVSANALSNRLSCDGYLKEQEITKLETFWNVNLIKDDETIEVDYYPEFIGSYNNNEFVFSKNKTSISVPKKSFWHFSKEKHYSIINAKGDTMAPFIRDNDKLIVEHWRGEQITDGGIYVFCFNREIFTKRLVNNIDQIIVKSDNEIYPMRFIDKASLNSFLILGQIVGLLREVN